MFLFKFVSENASVECRFPWSFLARAILHQDTMQAHIAKTPKRCSGSPAIRKSSTIAATMGQQSECTDEERELDLRTTN